MKAKRGKCLALVAVLAMVVCAFAIALPAGGSDAATENVPFNAEATEITSSTALAAGNYVVKENVTLGTINGAATIYVLQGKTVELTSSDVAFKIIPVTSIASDKKSVTKVTGLELTNVSGVTKYEVSADASKITVTGTGVPTGDFGLSVKMVSYDYYPTGYTATKSIELIEGQSAIVKDATAYIVTKDGATATTTVAEISFNKTTSDAGITISATTGGAMTAGGEISGGTVTMEKGIANKDPSATITLKSGIASNVKADDKSAYLNAYVDADAFISATGQTGVDKVYGSVDNGTVDAAGVELVNATFSKVTIGSGDAEVVISAENATSTSAIAKNALKLGSGTLRLVSGDFEVAAATPALDVGVGAQFDIGVNASVKFSDAGTITLKKDSIMNVYGKLVSGENAVTIKDESSANAATFKAYSGAVIGQKITVATTNFDISGAMEEAIVNGNFNSDATFSQFQTVRVTEDITIAEGVEVKIYGKLIVEKDASITIAKGATLLVGSDGNNTSEVEILGNMEINGTFKVEGGKSVTISGNVDVIGTMDIGAKTVLKSGSVVTVEENATLNASNDLEVSAGAKVSVEGTIKSTGIKNAGEIVIDGIVDNSDATGISISMAGKDAVVDLKSVTFTTAGNALTITDKGLEFAKDNEVGTDNENKIVIEPTAVNDVLTNLKIVEKITSEVKDDGTVEYTNNMDISGSPEAKPAEETAVNDQVTVTVTALKGATVSGTLTIGKYITFKNAGKLLVSGQMNQIESDSGFTNNGTIDVTGQIKTLTTTTIGTINAAMYKAEENGKNYNFYTTLKLAIDNGAKDIKVLGTITVKEDLTVPAGVTVTGGILNIGTTENRDVTVAVEDGAKFKNANITVNGTLMFAVDKTGNKSNNITSDVRTTDGTSSKYTNLYKALNDAKSGETVTVTGDDVTVTQDITIGEGVTLVIPAGKFVTINDNVTVNVIGTMDAWEKLKAQTDFAEKASGEDGKKASAITVTGIFKSNADVKFDVYKISGAYFTIVTSAATYNYATPVAYAASVSKDVQAGAIAIYGTNTVGDLAFAGTDTQPVTVTVYGILKAGTIDLELASVTTSGAEACFSGTVGSDVGAVTFAFAKDFTVRSMMSGETEVVKLTSPGVSLGDAKKTLSVSISAGTVTVDTDSFKVSKLTVAENAKLLVTKNAVADVADLTVNGQADATNGGKIKTVTLSIMGTVTVGKADSDKGIAAGAVEAKNVFIGITKKAAVGAAAAFNADTVTGLETVYLAAGSSVTEDLVKDMKKTVYSVEGSEYITVFAIDGKEPAISELVEPELAGKKITGWSYVKNGETKMVENEKVGAISAVSAVIDTEVYNITITADYGFADIFIDGAKVASISGGVTQYVNGKVMLTAGTHTIDWKLKNNYAGDITGTFDGKQISDKKFTISSDMKFDGVSYSLVLTGAVEQPQVQPSTDNGGDDGMGITDILLIVLVVLIAVMAIMVALRLMRS